MNVRPCGNPRCVICHPPPKPPAESLAESLIGLAGVVLFGLAVVLLWVWAG